MSFPLPPNLYKLYSPLSKDEPPPPPAIVEGNYTVFGQTFTTEIPQAAVPAAPKPRADVQRRGNVSNEWTSKQLFPDGDIDKAAWLKKLNKQLLDEYLELLDRLARNDQEDIEARKASLGHVIANMYALLARYRPHQAGQSLIASLNEQVKNRNFLADEVMSSCKRARQTLIADVGFGEQQQQQQQQQKEEVTVEERKVVDMMMKEEEEQKKKQQQQPQNNNNNNNSDTDKKNGDVLLDEKALALLHDLDSL